METKQTSVVPFSDYLVNLFASKGDTLTNKKLQKLLYYVQAWHLVYFDGQNIFKETPQAWRHGPVYPEVYAAYKEYSFNPILPKVEEISFDDVTKQLESFGFNERQEKYLAAVINHYGVKTALQLELLSHSELPWIEARSGLDAKDSGNKEISIHTMRKYYSELE